mmetsp:Transcript_17288/g.40559  ORF Transcript_17288/g.40559 Transcript_17288/m.40559 type:complete len:210 (+) Transcript_17288:631-1260(+)
MFASESRSSSTTLRSPWYAARCSEISRASVVAATLAPASSRTLATPRCPLEQAWWSGVKPLRPATHCASTPARRSSVTLSRSPFSLASSSASASSALDAVITRSSASPATLSCNSPLAPRSASMARLEPITLPAEAETMDEDESGARKTPPRFRPPEAVVGRGGREAFMFSTSTCGMPRERAGGGGGAARTGPVARSGTRSRWEMAVNG